MDWNQVIPALLLALASGSGIGVLLNYLATRHQIAAERQEWQQQFAIRQRELQQQADDALWKRIQEDSERRDRRLDELEAENEEMRKELKEARQEITSLRVENDTLRQSNANVKNELQAAKKRQEESDKRHLESLNEVLRANAALERELREMRGRMRKVEASTGPLNNT